jgi:ribosomal protein S19E (S16A)
MARWIDWRKIANKDFWYEDAFDWEGAAVYELGISGPRGGNFLVKYVGETNNEKQRITKYAQNGSHISNYIFEELELGSILWYRSLRMNSKEDAVTKQNKLLKDFDYPWNKHRNS